MSGAGVAGVAGAARVAAAGAPSRRTRRQNSDDRRLALTCVGPARVGSTEALLRILARAGAPLLGLSSLTLDDIAIIHLLTRRSSGGRTDISPDLRADMAISQVLGLEALEPPMRNEKLRDYRLVVSPRPGRSTDPGLAALWLGWQAPAATDALRLTLDTLQRALDDAWARHRAGPGVRPRSGHLNIEYIACRNTTAADRLQGRMQVAVDLHAFGPPTDDDLDAGTDPSAEGLVSAARFDRFCSDVQHQWREALSLALGTPYVEVDVVWRESWLSHLPTPSTPDHDLRPL